MCTMSWLLDDEGYRLFFNRDERRTRRPARPPAPGERGGVRFLAPRDGDHEGTWLLASERGLTLALLNLYEAERPRAEGEFRSRGLLVLDLADLAGPEALEARLEAADLPQYQPFSLAAFAPGRAPRLAQWNGERLSMSELGPGRLPFVSSAFRPGLAREIRRSVLEEIAMERGRLDEETMLLLHAAHRPERGPLSPCMHREDACTVSFSRVEVDARQVSFTYLPHSPCRGTGGAPLLLTRESGSAKGDPEGSD
jgi:hypothetical protein